MIGRATDQGSAAPVRRVRSSDERHRLICGSRKFSPRGICSPGGHLLRRVRCPCASDQPVQSDWSPGQPKPVCVGGEERPSGKCAKPRETGRAKRLQMPRQRNGSRRGRLAPGGLTTQKHDALQKRGNQATKGRLGGGGVGYEPVSGAVSLFRGKEQGHSRKKQGQSRLFAPSLRATSGG
jgi:hypothetical protein